MTLGVLGTMVWDRIEHPDGEAVERWGGITYSLAAAAAAAPEGWRVRPIVKLGADLAEEGRAFLDSVPGLERPGGVVDVSEPNNRVRLRYRDRHHRDEFLTGGVPGWDWPELEEHMDGLDGLYVNLVSGFELDAATVATLRDHFNGPRYVDLHCLVMAVAADGRRLPRPPERRDTWLGAFHVIQANEREIDLVAGADGTDAAARRAVRGGARAVLVTRGARGASWFARSEQAVWPAVAEGSADVNGGGTVGADMVEQGAVEQDAAMEGDPTGCGDVWGATCFTLLMRGARLTEAMESANRAAARNVNHRGADGLYGHLRTGL